MGCLKIDTDEQLRMKFKMCEKESKEIKRENIDYEKLAKAIKDVEKKPGRLGKIKEMAMNTLSVIGALGVVAVICFYFSDNFAGIREEINEVKTQVGSVSTEVGQLNTEIDEMNTLVTKMHNYLYLDDGVKDQLGMINEALNIKVINVTDENTMSFIEDVSVVGNDVSTTTLALMAESTIGVDVNGNVYIAKELIGETILLTYRDEDKDVFFLGQYNENYHWDGYCVTNAYNTDGSLYGICESEYDDGRRIGYKTVLSVGINEWDYYERECVSENNGEVKNVGISASYNSPFYKITNFTKSNVRVSDILYTSDFIESENKILKQYYNGETSYRKYNDSTGDAYLIKFEADGTVNSLYVGQFVNGRLEDATGNACNIIYSENDGYYVCNTGVFTDNHAVDYADVPFSQEDINKKIEGFNFDCELKWKIIE